MERCPVCKWGGNDVACQTEEVKTWVDCPRCGRFALENTWLQGVRGGSVAADYSDRQKAVLGYAIRKSNPEKVWNEASLRKTLEGDYLPSVAEQVENLIYYLGCQQKSAGDRIELLYLKVLFLIGAIESHDVMFLIRGLVEENVIVGSLGSQSASIVLTIKGWDRFAQLAKGVEARDQGFMAMPFGYEALTRIFYECWKPAAEQTGLPLERLDDNPKAGSISHRMQVEIRRSKYLVAELTYNNPGAYWEAGFAEGLGKPVIYLCEKSFFDDPENGIHFDVSQKQGVIWEADKLDEAKQQLKDIIRNTFPEDAKMSDDSDDSRECC
ncbi:MAG: nucleoside 2-deoxyribosyltransferase [Xanthomonadales bacterium]|nr:nucleoside 2-deoxyribosyltransferase [Xanthomonadales bacterium]